MRGFSEKWARMDGRTNLTVTKFIFFRLYIESGLLGIIIIFLNFPMKNVLFGKFIIGKVGRPVYKTHF